MQYYVYVTKKNIIDIELALVDWQEVKLLLYNCFGLLLYLFNLNCNNVNVIEV